MTGNGSGPLWRRPVAALIAAFLISRMAYYAAGVRFDLRPLDSSWQILDPALLRGDLLTSLLYMPGQPPLYNLLLGAILKISTDDAILTLLFHGLFSGMALASVLLLYALLRRLAISRMASFLVALVFLLTPALMLYESMPYYTLPVLALLGLMAWLFHVCIDAFSPSRALALFAVLAALIYTRSMFQWPWFVVLVIFCAMVLPGHRKQVLAAAVVPLVLILALYAKNAAITGHFATSDWLGMSLSKLSTLRIDKPERRRLVAAGQLSEMALMDFPFAAPEAYPKFFEQVEPTGVRVLDQARKSTGHINYNHLAYASVSQQALDDAMVSIWTHPDVYLRAVGTAWLIFMRPAGDYRFLHENRAAIAPWSRAFALGLAGQPVYPVSRPKAGADVAWGHIGILITVGYALAIGFGLWLLLRCAWRRQVSTAEATLIFLWLNIVYVSVVGNAFEVGENLRFRFSVNPFIAALLTVLAQRAWAGLRHNTPFSNR